MYIFVLFFFSWTFGGLFEIAYAATNSKQSTDSHWSLVKSQKLNKHKQRPEEKFQKAIEDIEKIIKGVEKVGRLEDEKRQELKARKTDLEIFDIEIRKEFKETEKKLKDEGLPQEILERHYNFVRHYENNLNELKNNLDKIEKAKDKKEADDAIDKTKKFLEKVKPPKRHVPLDPNKLPHRTVEPKFIEPRTNPEEFLKDSSQNTVGSSQGKTNRQNILNARKIPLSPPLLKGDFTGGVPQENSLLWQRGVRGDYRITILSLLLPMGH